MLKSLISAVMSYSQGIYNFWLDVGAYQSDPLVNHTTVLNNDSKRGVSN